jgi:hypothetical protein
MRYTFWRSVEDIFLYTESYPASNSRQKDGTVRFKLAYASSTKPCWKLILLGIPVLPFVSCLTVLEADGRSSPWNHLPAQLWYLAKTQQNKRNYEKWQETVKKWKKKRSPKLIRISKNWEPPWQETLKQIKGKTYSSMVPIPSTASWFKNSPRGSSHRPTDRNW